ncbi:MAG: ATP-binding protein [Bacteroidales bacterium]|jgi:hypothetical protein|nr:ATP-binding protein [Bacteroidales bacterium]
MDISKIRNWPVGIQDFKDLRQRGCIYVDKTQYIPQLIAVGKPYFLGRPRRFGKSLFASTLRYYFEGEKESFRGLAIEAYEKEWKKYPVIYIDFNISSFQTFHSLEVVIDNILKKYEAKYGITDIADDLSVRFSNLIRGACTDEALKVAVIIDEYDKPLVNTMENQELNDTIRAFMKGFYGVLKAMDSYLRFVFITGVTKFSKVSVFSDLNQLTDITMDRAYAGICGITETELITHFNSDIQTLANENHIPYEAALAKLKKLYDGYHFAKDSEGVYNPFSIMHTFRRNDFGDYWFETGTPTMLVKILENNRFDIRKFENDLTIAANSIDDYRFGQIDITPLLYQSGYLTIKAYDPVLNQYTLGFPNEEVKYGFLVELMPQYAPVPGGMVHSFSAAKFVETLFNGDAEGFMTLLKAFFASIPYDAVKAKHRDEQHYQYTFWMLFKLMGQFVETEVKSAQGRADAVVITADAVYVFEFKLYRSLSNKRSGTKEAATATSPNSAEAAIRQIDDKGYLIPYSADGKRLVKIGAEFSISKRGIKRWLIKENTVNK